MKCVNYVEVRPSLCPPTFWAPSTDSRATAPTPSTCSLPGPQLVQCIIKGNVHDFIWGSTEPSPTHEYGKNLLGLYRISDLPDIRPFLYPVSFAGYPARKTVKKSRIVLTNKIITIYNRSVSRFLEN